MTKSLGTYKKFFIVLGIVCAVAIGLNLVVRQGPVQDANAVDDLRSVSGAIDSYVSNQSQLPTSLSNLSGLSSATKQRLHNYEYTPTGYTTYRLCANFSASSNTTTAQPYPVYGNTDPGTHGQGRQCFSYTANPLNGGAPKPL